MFYKGLLLSRLGKNTKRRVFACSLKTVSLHWLVSPLSFSLPCIGTWNKMSSSEDTSTDKVHLFLLSGKWSHGIPNHAQRKSKRFDVMDAFGAGGNSRGGGGPAARGRSRSLPQWFRPSADLHLKMFRSWICSTLCSLPSPEGWRESYCKDQDTINSASCPKKFANKIKMTTTWF